MEPKAAAMIAEDIAKNNNEIYLDNIIIDGNTMTMVQLQNKLNGGLLCDDVETPHKRADIGHCVRGFGQHCKELTDMPMSRSRVKKEKLARCKKSFAYWARYHKANRTHTVCMYQ
eukprot:8945575-Ditylum_brightwellii.AAC.1